MFGFLKIFKRKPVQMPVEDVAYEGAENDTFAEEEASAPVLPQPGRGMPGGGNNGRGIQVPLQPILNSLPLELQPRVRCQDVGDSTISIPLEKILSQLSRGSVKISFGELRQASPGVFSTENDRDRVLIQLPLNEILTQLNPALIARRRVQKQVEVPDDISSPFESQNQNFTFSIGSGQPQRAPQPQHTPPPQYAPPPQHPPPPQQATRLNS